jgi:glycosyltransferase involved in cell wall biosynthesis
MIRGMPMSSHPDKPVVALYLRYYLSPSETFVHRQLVGVSDAFTPIVLASETSNLDLFPTARVFAKGKGLAGKAGTRLVRILSGRFAVATPGQVRFWKRALEDQRARLVHAHFGHFGLDVLPAARALGLPLLVTFHGFDASSLLNDERYTRQLRDLFGYAHAVTVSTNMAERLSAHGLREGRFTVHHIGVPVEEFGFVDRTPAAEKIARGEPLAFLQVSNFVEKKGHRYTVEAFSRYLRERPGDRLVLAGDGPLRSRTEEMCESYGIADRVEFVGRVVRRQVSDLMRSADVFVHHSVTGSDGDMEGIPTVIMEAMSTGLPVVSTKHSGIPELVDHGREGFLVSERDVEGYAAALLSFRTADPAMGKSARKKIEEKFNIAVQNAELKRIYRRAIDGSVA